METAIKPELTRTQSRKLHGLLADAAANVPWYRREYARLGISGDDLSDPGVLEKLPVLTKSALLDIPLAERLNSRFDIPRLAKEATTGSTGQPFSLYVDRRYKIRRNLRFLRGLLATGYRPWHTLMLLTDRYSEALARRHGWHYCSVEQPTAAIAEAYLRVRPTILYGFTTPLRLLAEYLDAHHSTAPRPQRVITTAEMLSSGTRDRLASVFQSPVFDFYGMTEMGLVAWQAEGADGYIRSPYVITEFVPDAACEGRFRMVMTNLDLRTCPIIRFDSGDIALTEERSGKREIISFEGRRIDSILCRDGSEISPYRVTDALRDIPGLRHFKVTQLDLLNFVIASEVDAALRDQAKEQMKTVLTRLLGQDVALQFEFTEKLIPEGAAKFRPVQSLAARC